MGSFILGYRLWWMKVRRVSGARGNRLVKNLSMHKSAYGADGRYHRNPDRMTFTTNRSTYRD